MSKINNTNSYDNDGKSSKLIIISKSRLSSAKDNSNFMTIYEGDKKITCDIGKENIQKKKLKKVFSTLKEALLKYSSSTGKLDISIKKMNNIPKRNKLNISINNEIKYNNQNKHNLNTIETCNELITYGNNKEIKIEKNIRSNYNNKIKKKDIIEDNFKNKSKNDNREEEKENDNEGEDSFDFNLEELKIINIEKLNNNKNISQQKNTNLLTQNYFKNIKYKNKLIEENYHIYKSEEIKKNSKESDKAVKSISELKSRNEQLIKILDSERSSNKQYLNLNFQNKKNDNIDKNNLKTEERQLVQNDEENKKDSPLNSQSDDKNSIENKIFKFDKKTVESENYFNCSICEYSYLESAMFIPDCNVHYLCKKCTKNYYEELIDDGFKELFCPFLQCKKGVNLNKLKSFISQNHFSRFQSYKTYLKNSEENKLIYSRLKTNINKENVEFYSRKHVIDINTNKNFYNYKGSKDSFCPFCNEETLFKLTNNHFYKCLNCLSKVCKYCFKEFNSKHIDYNYPGRCKVYFRCDDLNDNKQNKFCLFLKQLLFVIVIYYLTFAGLFLLFRNKFFIFFDVSKKNLFPFKYILCYFFSILIFIIAIPFIVIIYPYFPSIITLFDYK